MTLYRLQRIHMQNQDLIVSCVKNIWLLPIDNTHLMDRVTVGEISPFVRFPSASVIPPMSILTLVICVRRYVVLSTEGQN